MTLNRVTNEKKQSRKMEQNRAKTLFIFCLFLIVPLSSSNQALDRLTECLFENFASDILYTQTNSSYFSRLEYPIQNLRFSTPSTPKPIAIITPLIYSHVQVAVICCRQHKLKITTRSGGHSYEGLSSTSHSPFVILDLADFRSISVDIENNTAWVQSGATVGQLYYWIADQSPLHAFPAGICPSVGVGGHFSGGGFGMLLRNYGLAADLVIDAHIIDLNGQVLNRKSMGEDLFWAIRGGGGASFGVILAWKIELVYVPRTVTVFNVARTLDQGATNLVYKWQTIGHRLDEDLFIRVVIDVVGEGENKTIQATFNSLFLGEVNKLMEVMDSSFPELGLDESDCAEMSWIESVLYFSVYLRGQTPDSLRNRTPEPKSFFKATSDYVTEPIPESGLEELWMWCLEDEDPILIFDPCGGKLNDISESEIPYPHRAGNLYSIQYLVKWEAEEFGKPRMNWISRVYENMTPYVSKNPRSAYLNYGDLDFGTSDNYKDAMKWGCKYFKNNFERLAMVKGKVDQENFFSFEQSIPPLIDSVESLNNWYDITSNYMGLYNSSSLLLSL